MAPQDERGGEDRSNKYNIWDLPDVPNKLPPHLELQKTRVVCNSDAPIHTEGIVYSGAYASMGIDNSVRLENFCANFRVSVIRLTEDEMEFDMIGIDAAIANAFRRILIAEVLSGYPLEFSDRFGGAMFGTELGVMWPFENKLPTMAIEKVFIANNTSVIQDEVLAHRLGLIPIAADPRLFEYLSENDQPKEKNTIVFKLHARCEKGAQRRTVKSDELEWLPNGSEFVRESSRGSTLNTSKPETYTSFTCSQDTLPEFSNTVIAPKHPNIIIAKLGPGQEIELEAHAVKGMGKTHAKWSPVATAWYRMLPEVVLLKDVEDELAEELVNLCPAKVFDIEDIGKGRKRATVARPRACTLCRECIREDGWEERVALRRVRNHFIFTIESTGALPPEVLFTEAVKILEDKCERVITELS